MLRCRALDAYADHFFTARPLRLRGDSPEVQQDWARVATAIGVPAERLWRMRQVHGCAVALVPAVGSAVASAAVPTVVAAGQHDSHDIVEGRTPLDRAVQPPEADALISDDEAAALAVQVADCVPVLLGDDRSRVAAVHAGWRGAAANIVAETVRLLVSRYGVAPAGLVAAVGPSIGPCCYQVGPEVRAQFLASRSALPQVDAWFTPDTGDRLKLDMWQVTRDQLVAAGLLPERIHVARLCTACHVDQLYSYRAEGAAAGRLLGVIRGRPASAR